MKIIFRYISFIILFVIIAAKLNGQISSDRKKVVHAYKVETTTNLEVQNKYGKVQIITHDKDSAIFVINVEAKASNPAELEKLMHNIDFDFTQTSYFIGAKTIIGSGRQGILSDLKILAENFVSDENQIKIDYTIYLPNYLNIRVENKYGDVYVDNLKGDFRLNLSNGNFKANCLTGINDLDLKFCNNIDINKINIGRITMSYSQLHIKEATNLNLTTKSSGIVIDNVSILKIQSKSDKYFITRANSFFADTYFTNVNISALQKELNIKSKYGSLSIESIDKSFSFINVDSQVTDLNFYFQQGSAYRIDIMHKENIINYPVEISKLEKQAINKDEEQFLTHGTIGGTDGTSKVKIESERSTINIVHR